MNKDIVDNLLQRLDVMSDILRQSINDYRDESIKYTAGDLEIFGNYILSDERKEMYLNHPHQDNIDKRMNRVNHSDIMNALHNDEKE